MRPITRALKLSRIRAESARIQREFEAGKITHAEATRRVVRLQERVRELETT